MTIVDYKAIKPVIVKSCTKSDKHNNSFSIDIEKLNGMLKDMNLVALPCGAKGRRVAPEDMYAIAEYFFGDNLDWFEDSKYFTTIICIDKADIDENVQALIDDLYIKHDEDPDIDKVDIISTIISKLHCYFVMVVSYNSGDPGRGGKNTYFINCRANKVVLKDPEYVYNSKDM
jgi:hypothetical protein